MFLTLFLAACSEYDINSLDTAKPDPVDNSTTVQSVVECVYSDQSAFIAVDALSTGTQQNMQTAIPSILPPNFTETDLRSGYVPANLVILANQNDSFYEEGDYAFFLDFNETTENLEEFTGSSLSTMAISLSLSGVYARADVLFNSTPRMSFECAVFDEGASQGGIYMVHKEDTTGAGTILTTDDEEISLTDAENQDVQALMYDNVFKIASTTTSEITDPADATLDTPDLDVLEVIPLNQYLLE